MFQGSLGPFMKLQSCLIQWLPLKYTLWSWWCINQFADNEMDNAISMPIIHFVDWKHEFLSLPIFPQFHLPMAAPTGGAWSSQRCLRSQRSSRGSWPCQSWSSLTARPAPSVPSRSPSPSQSGPSTTRRELSPSSRSRWSPLSLPTWWAFHYTIMFYPQIRLGSSKKSPWLIQTTLRLWSSVIKISSRIFWEFQNHKYVLHMKVKPDRFFLVCA